MLNQLTPIDKALDIFLESDHFEIQELVWAP
jgi:hypothetical protein